MPKFTPGNNYFCGKNLFLSASMTFFHETYYNLTSYILLSKNIKVFQWLLKSKFLSFMTEVNSDNRNETNSDIFSWNIFRSDIILQWSKNTKIFP